MAGLTACTDGLFDVTQEADILNKPNEVPMPIRFTPVRIGSPRGVTAARIQAHRREQEGAVHDLRPVELTEPCVLLDGLYPVRTRPQTLQRATATVAGHSFATKYA